MSGSNGHVSDLIGDFLDLTSDAISPGLFRLWAGIALVAGALERRVWAKTRVGATFPNMYTLLVAPPGVGKFIVEEVRGLWTEAQEPGSRASAFHVAPDSMTKASLMDTLGNSKTVKLLPGQNPMTYHSLLVAAEEFSVLLPDYNMEYIGALNSIYMNKAEYREERRASVVRHLNIENPQLNILGGAQPSWLASIFPEDAWNTGIARRLLMIYCSEAPVVDIFGESSVDPALRARVLARLGQLSMLYGQMKWEPAAAERLGKWHLAGGPPAPTHSKLVHYNRSRTLHATKLSIVAAIAATGHLVIREQDVNRALEWLLDAEQVMPDVFRAMVGKSDRDVLGELHLYASARFAQTRKPVRGEELRQFLLERLPHDKVETILMAADRAAIVQRIAGEADLWVPKARMGLGAE